MPKHKYISQDAAIEQTCFNCAEREMCNGVCDDTDRIRAIPAADVVEVVRCKDCIHAPLPKSYYCNEIKWPKIDLIFDDTTCPYYCDDSYYSRRPLPDWFCCHGERREDDAET